MISRLFLAAGVAALAVTAPASAKPGGNGNGHGGQGGGAAQVRGGGGGHGEGGGAPQFRGGNGGGGGHAFQMQSFERHGGGGGHAFQMQGFQRQQRQSFAAQNRGHGNSGMRFERANNRQMRQNAQRFEQRGHQNVQRFDQRQARNFDRQQLRGNRMAQVQNRQELRNVMRGNRMEQLQNRDTFRNDRLARAQNREALRNELRANRIDQLDHGMFVRDGRLGNRALTAEEFRANGYGVGGCPPGLASKGCMPPGQAAKLLGTRIADAERFAALSAVPLSARYLYPDTNDYYYRYGDGYLYRVDRSSSLVDALLPLAFGGYMPGSYLPNSYLSDPYYGMNSYFPAAYGFNNFYPDNGNDCYRYGDGVVYQVDCYSGFVENVIPMYAGGYGVGQMIPTDYSYYNVPMQYRDLYYPTADSSYWYAPGAIYQYDTSSNLITSVAALMSPGFTIGQPLPAGYGVYNVPYDYRSTYYDTPNASYRYNNGYIYQVDPTTQLVTAIVASLLT